MSSNKVLVIGASGFLGSRLASAFLKKGVDVCGTVRATSDLASLDYCGVRSDHLVEIAPDWSNIGDIISSCRPSVIINTSTASFGAESKENIASMVRTNLVNPSVLLAEMLEHNVVHFINCGTSWQTVRGKDYEPFNFYAATKQAFEDLIAAFTRRGLIATTLRLFDTYGPGDHRRKIVNLIIESNVRGTFLDMSPGEQKLDLIHIEDVVEAFLTTTHQNLACSEASHRIYQVTSDAPIVLRDVADIIAQASGLPSRIRWGARSYRPGEIMEPTSDLPRIPSWRPNIDIKTGLAQCVTEALRPSQA